jgi:hypothetical protein
MRAIERTGRFRRDHRREKSQGCAAVKTLELGVWDEIFRGFSRQHGPFERPFYFHGIVLYSFPTVFPRQRTQI